MASSALLVRMDAKHGKDREIESALLAALPTVEEEQRVTAWFAMRFGRGEYGIFEVFSDDSVRQAHMQGPTADALERVRDLCEAPPRIEPVEIIAEKMPIVTALPDTKGLLLTFRAKAGHEGDVENFLKRAQLMAMSEPETTAWFAIRTASGEYGIFDVFPDNAGRFAHLVGHVTRELAKESLSLLGSAPHVEMVSVKAEKLAA